MKNDNIQTRAIKQNKKQNILILILIMNKLIFLSLLLFTCCSNNSTSKTLQKDKGLLQYDCVIPDEILNYISSHPEDFELLDVSQDLKSIEEYLKSDECPITCKGDFNQNGKEDFAIILKYKRYKDSNYPNHIFPFLVVFNDYKDTVTPYIVFKTGGYKDDPIKTVIYEQNEGTGEMLTYIEKGYELNRDVIRIIYPEKSSFYMFWNNQTLEYEFFNYLDEHIGENINSIKSLSLVGSWYFDCNYNEPEFL